MLQSSTPKNSTTVRSKQAVRFARAALQTAYLLSEDLGSSFAERLFTTPRRFPRPDRERAVLATARRSTTEVTLRSPRWRSARLPLATWRWGHGPAVLLVHGWEGRGSQLGALVEPLVRAGMSVVAFDAPAHGDSPGQRMYLTDFADAISGVADTTGPLHGIVAHSFGAAGVLLAGMRDAVRVERNVLIAPNIDAHASVRSFVRMLGLDDADRILLEQRLAEHAGISLDALRPEAMVRGRTEALLVIHDRDDREVRIDEAERLAALWPNAELRVTEGLGHRRILRDPDVIAATVELLGDGIAPPASDLVREVDRQLEGL